MASQVLSGASNPTYTNNTGQNVRVIINYMRSAASRGPDPTPGVIFPNVNTDLETITINWAGVSASRVLARQVTAPSLGTQPTVSAFAIGKSVATSTAITNLPNEILLSSGQTFSAVCSVYNIVVIPENG